MLRQLLKFFMLVALLLGVNVTFGQASLPFSYDGGNPNTNVTGLSQTGLGSNYSSSPQMKFDTTDDELILNFNGTPGVLGYVLKWNPSSGTSFPGTFEVSQSSDGSTYTVIKSYGSGTGQTNITSGTNLTESGISLNAATKYIKWKYTSKTNGNIALGSLSLSAGNTCAAPTVGTNPSNQSVTAPATASFSVAATGSGTLSYQWQVNTGSSWANVTTGTGGTTATYTTSATTAAMSGYQYRAVVTNTCSGGGTNTATSTAATLSVLAAPAPEINIQQAGTNIAHNGSFAFGNQTIGTENTLTFTVQNTGNLDLSVGTLSKSGTNADQFTITQAQSATVAGGGNTTFTVTFTPTGIGSKTATLSLVNNDSDENPYVINLTGSGVYSSASNVITNSSFGYTSNIDYTQYNVATISNTSHSIGVFGITIQDGAGTADADAQPTILSGITFAYTGLANTVKAAALFDGNAFVATGTVSANGIVFSGLSGSAVTAIDGGSKNLTLRVTFNSTVTDNQQLVFSISTATADASGSSFAASNAGGATSVSDTSNNNRLVVTATTLAFAQQPGTVGINNAMTPAVTVSANDANGNRDLDFTGAVGITSTGTLTGSPVTANAVSGLATFSSLTHTAAATGRTLTATSGSWSVVSGNFDVIEIIYSQNDWRSASAGTWNTGNTAATATWEKWGGTSWVLQSAGTRPTSSTAASGTVYIRHAITSSGAITLPTVVVQAADAVAGTSAGSLTAGSNGTISNKITVQNGAKFTLTSGFTINGTFEIEDGGEFIINYDANNNSGFWNGTEIFHPNSKVTIKNWGAGVNTSSFRPLFNGSNVSNNTFNGYSAAFGNIEVDLSAGTDAGNFTLISAGVNANLAHGNVNLLKPYAANNINVAAAGSDATSGIGGDFIIDQNYTTGRKVGFSTAAAALNFTIKGNLIVNGGALNITSYSSTSISGVYTINVGKNLTVSNSALIDFMATASTGSINLINVNVAGNVTVGSSAYIFSTGNGSNINLNFNGISSVPQTIDIASTSTSSKNVNLRFNVKNGAYVKLLNRDLELGSNSKLTVETGGTLDFSSASGTPLNIKIANSQTGTAFESQTGSILKITSADGINTTGTGNVQVTASNRNYSQTGEFHYVGAATPQATGSGIGTGSTAKRIVIDKDNAADVVNLTNSTGLSNTGNGLYIKKGTLVETQAANISGGGSLTMDADATYKTAVTSASVPQLSSNYTLAAGSTIELNATADTQTLKGGKDYANLTFSGGGTKTTTSGIGTIAGILLIKDAATLNTGTSGMGGAGTNLTMQNTAKFITGGSGTKPDAQGAYSLAATSAIEFTGPSATNIRLNPAYGKIIVSGTNVGTSSAASGLQFQSGGSFEVVNGGLFKVNNPAGFNGGTTTAVSTTGNPAILLGDTSTVEYTADANQTVTAVNATAPDATAGYGNLTVNGSGAKTLEATVTAVRNDFTVGGSATVNVTSGKTLKVTNQVVNQGSNNQLTVDNNAALVQINNVANTTDITVIKNSNSLYRFDYTLWSAPVEGQNLKEFSPFTLNNRFYEYKYGTNSSNQSLSAYWSVDPLTNAFTAAKGFLIRMPNTDALAGFDSGDTAMEHIGIFKGKAHNGDVTVALSTEGNKFTAVGNPYPSPIGVKAFFDANNGAIDQSSGIYFWRKRNNVENGSYATVTLAGLNPNESGDNAQNGTGGQENDVYFPTADNTQWTIAPGQGFFVKTNAAATGSPVATFSNAMRKNATAGQAFFKAATTEASRYRIKLTNANGGFSQMMVAYMPEATTALDYGYDAEKLTEAGFISLYSVAQSTSLSIQARPEFEVSDVVPVGYTATAAGSYTLTLSYTDGTFAQGQKIYVNDKAEGVVRELSANSYTFTTEQGTFNDRFEVLYTNSALSTDTPVLNTNNVVIYQSTGVINVNSGSALMSSVNVYDVRGRKLFTANNINAAETSVTGLEAAHQVLIIEVNTDKGTVNKKIVF